MNLDLDSVVHQTEWFSVRTYGGVGDGVTDDAAAIRLAAADAVAAGGKLYFPRGKWLYTTPLTIDLSSHTDETGPGAIGIEGDGANNTFIINGTNSVGIKVTGSTAGSVFFTYFNMRGVTLTKTGSTCGDTALQLQKMVGVTFIDVVFLKNTLSLRASDLVLSTFLSTHFRFNTYGPFMEGQIDTVGSTPNAITFIGCILYGNAEYAGLFVGGCNVTFHGGSVETTNGGSNAIRFGIKMDNPGTYGRAACAFYGTYFERNGNVADVWINAGDAPITSLFSGCTFNRLSGSEFSNNALLFSTNSNNAARHALTVEACAFSRMGTYQPSAARPYIAITGSTPVAFNDPGNIYQDNIERPVQASLTPFARVKFAGSNGQIIRQQNVLSVIRQGVGLYLVTFLSSNTTISAGRTISITTDIGGFNWSPGESSTSISVQCTNASGVATDPGAVSIIVFE